MRLAASDFEIGVGRVIIMPTHPFCSHFRQFYKRFLDREISPKTIIARIPGAGQEFTMTSYLIRRLFQMVIVTFLVAVVTYWLFSISPGGPLTGLRQQQNRITAEDY